jgi:hypothetical protein
MYRVFRFAELERQRGSMTTAERNRLDALEQHLFTDPRGKMLGLPFFREKRLNGKRLLFLVYEEEQTVLLVMVTDKKHQQEDIDGIKVRLGEFSAYVRQRLR